MRVHPTKNCRWCGDLIDTEWLERHEAKCKNRTDTQREDSKRARIEGREAYHQGRHPHPKKPTPKSGLRRGATACRYCKQEIGQGQWAKHEAACRKRTPKQRAHQIVIRANARRYYHNTIPATIKNGGGNGHYSFWANGNGKRLSATISIDFKQFRALLLELAPSLSIDKVEVI